MDLLGFNRRTIEAFKKGAEEELFVRLHSVMSKGSELLKDEDTPPIWSYKVFTDNIVFGLPIRLTHDSESEFGIAITQIIYFQMSMALEGFFVRGGFTLGPLYIGEEMAYGVALLEAVDIEERIANNPRIIISKVVMDLIKKHLKYYAHPKESPQNAEILIDVDGQPFINYLFTAIDDDFIHWSAIQRHKQNIESSLEEFQNESAIWSKYLWVANYHNFFCRQIEDCPNKYFVDPKLLVQEPKRLVD
ncbi:MAG: hypothetical protein JRI96_05495 [Deltaproteobacteria bacterium]|nr:hypothetical protein [Deltaproteobacteria bacterium]